MSGAVFTTPNAFGRSLAGIGTAMRQFAHQSMQHARLQAGAAKVYAVEASDMAKYAQQLADQNPGATAARTVSLHVIRLEVGWL